MFAAPMTAAEHTVARVHAHRRMGIATRRRRMPKQQFPKLNESDYAKAIVGIVDLRKALAPLVAALPKLLEGGHAARGIRHDEGESRRAQELLAQARREVDYAMSTWRLEALARRMASATSEHQRGQLVRQARAAIGIDVHTIDRRIPTLIDHFAHENVALIRSLGQKAIGDVETRVARAFTTGQRAEDLLADIAARGDVTESHARLIARDQIGSLNAQVTSERHQELGISRFRWASMGDENVRPEHEALDGQVFDYDDPPSEGLPGEPVCCRCGQEPVYEDIHAALEGREPEPTPEPEAKPDRIPAGFSTSAKVDGQKLFDREPRVYQGVPTYRQTATRPERESVHVVRPSELVQHDVVGIDTGGDKPGDARTESIRKAWRDGKKLAPVEIDVSRDGKYFIGDGNHRVWAAIHEGDKPIAARFRRVEGDFGTMDKVRGRMQKALDAGKP